MPDDEITFSFRPRNEELEHWNLLRKACHDRGISMSEMFNCILLPMLSELVRQKPNKQKTYTLDLGSITFE